MTFFANVRMAAGSSISKGIELIPGFELVVWSIVPHAWQLVGSVPEARRSLDAAARFLKDAAGDVGPEHVDTIIVGAGLSGLGTAVFMVYLMRCCDPAHRAAHMAIVTALMSVSFTLAGVCSGFLASWLGFGPYFAFTFLVTIPGMLLVFFLPLFVIFYLLIFLPQQRQKKNQKQMLAALENGNIVLTSGGIVGTIVAIEADDTLVIRVKPDNVKIQVARSAVASVVPGESKK